MYNPTDIIAIHKKNVYIYKMNKNEKCEKNIDILFGKIILPNIAMFGGICLTNIDK